MVMVMRGRGGEEKRRGQDGGRLERAWPRALLPPRPPNPPYPTRRPPATKQTHRLEPSGLRSEGATALERIREMKRGDWAHSNSHIAKHVGELSPELRDLLDRIFVADEDARITVQVRAW